MLPFPHFLPPLARSTWLQTRNLAERQGCFSAFHAMPFVDQHSPSFHPFHTCIYLTRSYYHLQHVLFYLSASF